MSDFIEWIKVGMANGWCGPPVCSSHDGTPYSEAEYAAYDYLDPCIHIIRLYEDAEKKAEVEAWHSPSNWRKIGYG